MKIALALPPKARLAQDHGDISPQLGISYLAGGLRRDKVDVTVYNSKYKNIYEDELAKILIKESYDIIGFSAMTHEIKSVGRIAERIKSVKKDCLIAIGGCHLNAIPKETMEEFRHFDLACIGEHEDQIAKIFTLLHNRDYNELTKTDNIIFRRNDELVYKSLNRRFIADLDALAWPAHELFGSRDLVPAYFVARGCPFSCFFCQQNQGRALRKRNPIDVIDELEYFSKYFNQKTFSFRDESFGADKKLTIAICNELIKRGLNKKMKWDCCTHSTLADYDLFCLMREAGCYYVGVGVESGSDEILKKTGKNTTVKIIKNAFNLAKKAKLTAGALLILGHPYETKKTMLQSILLGVSLNPVSVTFSMMTPFPGTKVYEYASRHEAKLKLITKDWERYDNITGSAMVWDNFSVKTLKIFQATGLILYHLCNLRIIQFLKYLRLHRKAIIGYFISFFKIKNENIVR